MSIVEWYMYKKLCIGSLKNCYAIVFWCFLKCFSDVGLIKREWHLAYTQKLSSKEEIRLFEVCLQNGH